LWGGCDDIYKLNTKTFEDVTSDIAGQLLQIESEIEAHTVPLEASLQAALAETTIDVDNKEDMEKLNVIYMQETAPNATKIVKFFTIMNGLCDNATKVFASSRQESNPISVKTVETANQAIEQKVEKQVEQATVEAVSNIGAAPPPSVNAQATIAAAKQSVDTTVKSANLQAVNLKAVNLSHPPVPTGPVQNSAAILAERFARLTNNQPQPTEVAAAAGGRRRTKRRSVRFSRRKGRQSPRFRSTRRKKTSRQRRHTRSV